MVSIIKTEKRKFFARINLKLAGYYAAGFLFNKTVLKMKKRLHFISFIYFIKTYPIIYKKNFLPPFNTNLLRLNSTLPH